MFSRKNHRKGFSFVEMMTALGIAGVLGVTGLNSYRKQRQQARSAQAQYSLSNIYTAEKNFHNQWQTYHENLYAIGAIPEGELWYDAGFTQDTLSTSDGNLANYPWRNQLSKQKCNTHHELCKWDCATELGGARATLYGKTGVHPDDASKQLHGITCEIQGSRYVKDISGSAYAAGETTFTAIATSVLNSDDEWTINERQEVQHTLDGTGN